MIPLTAPVFAMLAFLAAGIALAVAAAATTGRTAALRGFLAGQELAVATAVAAVATAGSLFYSEVVGLVPCFWCWVQRALMYPLVILVPLVAWWPRLVRPVVIALAVAGAAVAVYHTGLEWMPAPPQGPCSADAPCDVPVFRAFGFMSLPTMALTGFAAIASLTWMAGRDRGVDADHPDQQREGISG